MHTSFFFRSLQYFKFSFIWRLKRNSCQTPCVRFLSQNESQMPYNICSDTFSLRDTSNSHGAQGNQMVNHGHFIVTHTRAKLPVKSTSRNMVLDIHNYCEISREFLYSSLTAAPIMAPLLAGSVKSRGKNALVSE